MFDFSIIVANHRFHFRAHRVTIGRDLQCGLVLPDDSVQPEHAVLTAADGRLFIERSHLDALTFLNRAPLRQRTAVYDGDVIDIGPWTLILRSRRLPRREDETIQELSLAGTPSDAAIVSTYMLKSESDDSTSSIIII